MRPDCSELHRIVFAGLQQPILDKAVAAFMALPLAERQSFVTRINSILDGRAWLDISELDLDASK